MPTVRTNRLEPVGDVIDKLQPPTTQPRNLVVVSPTPPTLVTIYGRVMALPMRVSHNRPQASAADY